MGAVWGWGDGGGGILRTLATKLTQPSHACMRAQPSTSKPCLRPCRHSGCTGEGTCSPGVEWELLAMRFLEGGCLRLQYLVPLYSLSSNSTPTPWPLLLAGAAWHSTTTTIMQVCGLPAWLDTAEPSSSTPCMPWGHQVQVWLALVWLQC